MNDRLTPADIHGVAQTYIQRHPPRDGKQYDAQCARCGSTWDIFTPPSDPDFVRGCLSSAEWCEENPLPGRENWESGPEWFCIEKEETK